MQEDKESTFDAIDTLGNCLRAVDGMVASMHVNADAMRDGAMGGYMAATDLADHLAERGVPFRDAHEVVGRLVAECEKRGVSLQQLCVEDLGAAHPLFGDDALEAVEIDRGGSASRQRGRYRPRRRARAVRVRSRRARVRRRVAGVALQVATASARVPGVRALVLGEVHTPREVRRDGSGGDGDAGFRQRGYRVAT